MHHQSTKITLLHFTRLVDSFSCISRRRFVYSDTAEIVVVSCLFFFLSTLLTLWYPIWKQQQRQQQTLIDIQFNFVHTRVAVIYTHAKTSLSINPVLIHILYSEIFFSAKKILCKRGTNFGWISVKNPLGTTRQSARWKKNYAFNRYAAKPLPPQCVVETEFVDLPNATS